MTKEETLKFFKNAQKEREWEHEREKEREREQHKCEKEVHELKLRLAEINAYSRNSACAGNTPTLASASSPTPLPKQIRPRKNGADHTSQQSRRVSGRVYDEAKPSLLRLKKTTKSETGNDEEQLIRRDQLTVTVGGCGVPSSATEDDSGSSLLATPAEQDQFYLTLQQQEDGSMAYVSGEGFSSQGGDMDNEASGLKISAVHFTESR
ncbi:hypothetical protein HPB51_018468 [Rhipicephalus microplus]|uniref:Uncharacterized protein n=1 Tax=Rhipicephalus microplus TaxID=6941 RepID=A0A9J6DB97_RHIMP|nr:hypothetical protein HPB51_018468 [Rhipicephalus microplus]